MVDYIAGVGCDNKSGTCTDYRSGCSGSPLDDGATRNSEGAIISGYVSEILEIAAGYQFRIGILRIGMMRQQMQNPLRRRLRCILLTQFDQQQSQIGLQSGFIRLRRIRRIRPRGPKRGFMLCPLACARR